MSVSDNQAAKAQSMQTLKLLWEGRSSCPIFTPFPTKEALSRWENGAKQGTQRQKIHTGSMRTSDEVSTLVLEKGPKPAHPARGYLSVVQTERQFPSTGRSSQGQRHKFLGDFSHPNQRQVSWATSMCRCWGNCFPNPSLRTPWYTRGYQRQCPRCWQEGSNDCTPWDLSWWLWTSTMGPPQLSSSSACHRRTQKMWTSDIAAHQLMFLLMLIVMELNEQMRQLKIWWVREPWVNTPQNTTILRMI